MSKNQQKTVLYFILLTAVYFIFSKLGLLSAFLHPNNYPLWTVTGIAVAFLLLFGYRYWPALFIGTLIANLTMTGTILVPLALAIGSTLEGLLAVYIINRFANGLKVFDDPQDTLKFILLAGLLSPIVGATIGTAALASAGVISWFSTGNVWFTWWLGGVLKILIVVPFLVIWSNRTTQNIVIIRGVNKMLLASYAILIDVSWLIFYTPVAEWEKYTYPFLIIPIFIWIALRLGRRHTVAATLVMTLVAITGTLAGHGPFGQFVRQNDLHHALLLLEGFIAVLAPTSLIISSAIASSKKSESNLLSIKRRLEHIVDEKNLALESTGEEIEKHVQKRTVELEAYTDQILHDSKNKDEFLAVLAHELRNPLSPILSYAQLAQMEIGESNPELKNYVDTIESQVKRMSQLLDDLLDMARIARGKIKLEKQRVDINQIIRQALVSVASLVKEHGHKLEVVFCPKSSWINADPFRMEQVLVNLLNNSIKYTDNGGKIKLGCRNYSGRMAISIKDNGMGIPKNKLSDIFEIFNQVNAPTPQKKGGLGIGLNLVKKIVSLHGGSVEAKSDGLGSGSEFIIHLPVT